MMFRKRYDGFQFDSGLALVALGKAGTDCEFNVLPRSGALVGAGLRIDCVPVSNPDHAWTRLLLTDQRCMLRGGYRSPLNAG
jgi:hypothetical protein